MEETRMFIKWIREEKRIITIDRFSKLGGMKKRIQT